MVGSPFLAGQEDNLTEPPFFIALSSQNCLSLFEAFIRCILLSLNDSFQTFYKNCIIVGLLLLFETLIIRGNELKPYTIKCCF